jgi:hypothetical protein
MKSSIRQIKNSVESLFSSLDQIQVKTSGLKDKVNVFEHSGEDKVVKMEYASPLGHHYKTKSMNPGHKKRGAS